MRRVMLLAGQETRLLKTEPWVVILLIFMPAVLAAFFTNGAVGGASQAVPGLAALFGFFGVSSVGLALYRDHGWMTWDRLRVSQARPAEIILGKLVPLGAVFVAQYIVLFTLGWAVFDMPWRGSIVGGAAVVLALVAVELAVGLLFAVLCSGIQQLNAFTSLAALLLAGVGGAFAPVGSLPGWVQSVSPASPVYWALKGFRKVITEPGGLSDVLRPAGILFAIAVASFALAAGLYDHEKRKAFFA